MGAVAWRAFLLAVVFVLVSGVWVANRPTRKAGHVSQGTCKASTETELRRFKP
jgi:hypothetical protein